MKLEVILGLLLVSGLSSAASGDVQPNTNPMARGVAEAIVNNCMRIDPEHATDYKVLLESLDPGVNGEVLETIRGSDEYKQAYQSTSDSLAAVKAADAIKTCRKSLNTGDKK